MPRVQSMDGGSGVGTQERWIAPPDLPVREPAQIYNARDGGKRPARKETRSDWPFMYSYKEGGCVVNIAPRKSAYAQAQDIGSALI